MSTTKNHKNSSKKKSSTQKQPHNFDRSVLFNKMWLDEHDRKLMEQTIDHFVLMSFFVLHDKFNFSRDQAARYHAELAELSESLRRKLCDMDGIRDCLINDCGYDFIEDVAPASYPPKKEEG